MIDIRSYVVLVIPTRLIIVSWISWFNIDSSVAVDSCGGIRSFGNKRGNS